MGFSLYLKNCSFVTFRPNVFKLSKAANSDMLFHVMNNFVGIIDFPYILYFFTRPLRVSKVRVVQYTRTESGLLRQWTARLTGNHLTRDLEKYR